MKYIFITIIGEKNVLLMKKKYTEKIIKMNLEIMKLKIIN